MSYINSNIKHNKLISIIVSTYSTKRINDFQNLLKSIRNQSYQNIEIVISVDENKELYHKIEKLIPEIEKNIKIIFNPRNEGLAHSRNIGVKNADGDIIAFVDDDAILFPDWAESIVKTFDGNNIGAVAGDIIPLWENNNMSWFPRELFWMISCSYSMTPDHKCEVERGFGTNMAFRKDIFYKVGMFDSEFGINGEKWTGGEDTIMFLKVKDNGDKVFFNPDAKVFHKIYFYRIKMLNIVKRAFNGGYSVAKMNKLRKYNISDSTEERYLRTLLFEFYPRGFKKLLTKKSVESLKQIFAVTMVIVSESIGYLIGKLRNRQAL